MLEPNDLPKVPPAIRSLYGLPPDEDSPDLGERLHWCLRTWYPALLMAAAMALLYLLIDLSSDLYDVDLFISRYGSIWCPSVITILTTLLGVLFTLADVRRNTGLWKLELLVIFMELFVAMSVFFAVVMPRYTYLELPDLGLYYFGETMGDKAVGRGRAFDKEKRLVYSGGFDNDTYEGQGTLYGRDYDWTGSFHNGKLNGYGEEKYPPILTVGRGRIIQRYRYRGFYRNGLRHGYGTSYYRDGTVCQSGWFEDGEYYGPQQPDNSGPGHSITPDD